MLRAGCSDTSGAFFVGILRAILLLPTLLHALELATSRTQSILQALGRLLLQDDSIAVFLL